MTFTVVVPERGRTKVRTLGRFTVKAAKGTTRFVFCGRVGGRTLKPGTYRVTVQAVDAAGNKGKILTKTLTVRR